MTARGVLAKGFAERTRLASRFSRQKFRALGTAMGERTKDRTIEEEGREPLEAGVGHGSQPCLTVIAGGPVGTTYTLSLEGETVIGRGLDADVRFDDQRISRRHARLLIVAKGQGLLEDLGSSNGTFVNGARIKQQPVKDGDKIQIGTNALLKFSYQDEAERNARQELFDRAIKDPITEIYTEQYFLDRISTEYAYAQRHEREFALLMFEADGLKEIRATYGNSACDFILKELARVVTHILRAEDVFARYDDTAFVILARDIGDTEVAVVAQRIRRTIKNHDFVFEGTQVPITICLGIATLSNKAKKPAKLIQIAEKYLSRAQKAGQNSIGGSVMRDLTQRRGSSTTVSGSPKNRAGGIMSLFDSIARLRQKKPTTD
ncbi:MAG: GGDEF domain-containing protein [Acidiferrobacterales bacterium]